MIAGRIARPLATHDPKWHPCVRCGKTRKRGSNTTPLCRDCRLTMTAAEVEKWAA